jgi:hypothetical protein
MKRLIVALGFTAVAMSAFALEYGPPYEQLNVDRSLPQIDFSPVKAYVPDERAPFEQIAIDRALPHLPGLPGLDLQYAQSASGSTLTDVGAGAEDDGDTPFVSPWANDWNFIAPAP